MTERGYNNDAVLGTMVPVILILVLYCIRVIAVFRNIPLRQIRFTGIVSSVGVIFGAIFMYLAITTPIANTTQFFIYMCLTAVFMPLSSPNVIPTVYDVTVPEVRSTAQAVEYFVENIGAASAPALAGALSLAYGQGNAILWVCVIAWGLCFLFYLGALFTVDKDIHNLRNQMAERAKSM